MKRTKFKTGILAVVFCSLTFLFSGDGNSIYADEILTDTEYLLVPALLSLKEKYEITAVAGNLDCPQMHSHAMTLKAAVQQAIFKNIFGNLNFF